MLHNKNLIFAYLFEKIRKKITMAPMKKILKFFKLS